MQLNGPWTILQTPYGTFIRDCNGVTIAHVIAPEYAEAIMLLPDALEALGREDNAIAADYADWLGQDAAGWPYDYEE